MVHPLVPAYGESTLGEVVPSIAAAQGVPGRWENVLGLPEASRYVLLMVDGLGELNLVESSGDAPYLSTVWASPASRGITSGAPSTTATSLTSLGTGLAPGQHGVAGYSFRNPVTGGFLNALAWEEGLSGYDVQPQLTAFERLVAEGVQVSSVCPARFEGSGLTEAGLRGPRFVSVPDEDDLSRRIDWVVQGATAGPRSLVYFYERYLDHAGHGVGWRSDAWRAQLTRVDAMAALLRARLPDDVRLVVTGDHGMIDVPDTHRLVIEDEPDLAAGLDLVAGEGRLRQVYTGEPDAVASRWRDVLGDRAWVRTRDEAVDEGWFGPLGRGMGPRFGDVVAALRGEWAIMTTTQEKEFGLVGMHGSLTALEMRVPLLVD